MRPPALLAFALLFLTGCETAPTTPPAHPAPIANAAPVTPPAVPVPSPGAPDASLTLKPADDFESSLLKPPVKAAALAEYAQQLSHLANLETDAGTASDLRRRSILFSKVAIKAAFANVVLPSISAEKLPDGTDTIAIHITDPAVFESLSGYQILFKRSDYETGRASYPKAAERDPGTYLNALYSGEAFIAKQQPDAALPCFAHAIATDAGRETAYRYRADALMRLGRTEEAGEDYINAFLCAPFATLPTAALKQWITAQNLKLTRPAGTFPFSRLQLKNRKLSTVSDLSVSEAMAAIDAAYLLGLVGYFEDHKGALAAYHHSLDQEMHALQTMQKFAPKLTPESPLPDDFKYIAQIRFADKMEKAGLLAPYILLDRPTEGIVQDYQDYLTKHHDLLVRYIQTVWLRKS